MLYIDLRAFCLRSDTYPSTHVPTNWQIYYKSSLNTSRKLQPDVDDQPTDRDPVQLRQSGHDGVHPHHVPPRTTDDVRRASPLVFPRRARTGTGAVPVYIVHARLPLS